jgi:hypothetical protein
MPPPSDESRPLSLLRIRDLRSATDFVTLTAFAPSEKAKAKAKAANDFARPREWGAS